jgi:PTS system ascorbate-specific IIB component
MKKLKIMVVCGFGLGSSMVLRMTLDSVLKEAGIKAETFCSDEATSRGEKYDIVFTSQPLVHLFEGKPQPVIVINNFLSKDEVKQKALPLIQQLSSEDS